MSLSDVKSFLRIDTTDDDSLLTSLIVSARRLCEEYTQRAFISQTWKLTLDRFYDRCEPELEGYHVLPSPQYFMRTAAIQLSRQPIQSITSIKTFGITNAQTTVDASVYLLDTAGGRVVLNEGQVWPTDLREYAAAEITFVAGYGDAGDVPAPIAQAITQTVSTMYESRQCADLPDGVKTLLAPFRLPEAFGCV